MIIRRVEDCEDTSRKIKSATSASTRLLLAEDQMGFSLNFTEIEPGLKIEMQYDHHLEAVFCLSGTGSIEDIDAQVTHNISPGTIYALDQHDAHILRSETKLELICVFNPALKGSEQREPGGGYPEP
ncbi:MAG: L-ectoine synthase [Rickettsiales bacterium]|nr:L-ectoine synthase [Rickettsiales bacterium]